LVVSGYTFSGSVATNNSPGGTPFNTALESSSFDVRDTATGAGGTVVGAGIASVYASANGFTAPTGPLVLGLTTGSFTNKGSSASNGTGTVESYFNPNNTVSTTAGAAGNALIGNGTTAALLPNTSQGTNDADFIALPAAYALNLALRVSFASAGGDWSNSSAVSLFGQGTQTNPVPEPASMAMWGLGLLGCMAMRMRRRNA